MLRTVKRMLPASAKQSIKQSLLNTLHAAVGRPVVSAMRERAVALEEVFDQRISRIEASVARIEEALGAIRENRERANGALRTDLMTRQDLLVSLLDQRLYGLERRLEQIATVAIKEERPSAAENRRPALSNGSGHANGTESVSEN